MGDLNAGALREMASAQAGGDWPKVHQLAEQIISFAPTASTDVLIALARASWHLNMHRSAQIAAQRAIEADPTLAEPVIIAAWAALAQNDGEKALEYYRRLVELNPNTPRWRLKVIKLLNTLGRLDEATKEIDELCDRWPDDRNARNYLKLFEPQSPLGRKLTRASSLPIEVDGGSFDDIEKRAPSKDEWRRPPLVPLPQHDVQIAEVEGARSAILVFAGGEDGVAIPLSIFDSYMAALNATTIYLRDFRRMLYLGGIRSLGGDYKETLSALRVILDRLQISNLSAIGNCSGAAAAIRYGMELGARRIVASTPFTHFPSHLKFREGLNLKAKRLAETVAPELMDLLPFLETRQPSERIEVFYKSEDDLQIEQATRISHIPGVIMHPLRGHPRDAALLRLIRSTEHFSKSLAQWLDIGEPGDGEKWR